jgi:hypothetical protein
MVDLYGDISCEELDDMYDSLHQIICPGCGWVGDVMGLRGGACPGCGYENNTPPGRLLTIGEMMDDNEPYNDVRMDLFLQSLWRSNE